MAGSDVRPNIILAAVVTVTILFGLGPGTLWAFVGGITANLLTTDPLGTLPLGLLLVAALTAGAASVFGRSGLVVAFLGGALGSVILDTTALLVVMLLGGAPPVDASALIGLMAPTAILNGLLTTIVWIVARAVVARIGSQPALA